MKITDTSVQDTVIATKKSLKTYGIILFYPHFSSWLVTAERILIGTVKRGDFVGDLFIQGRGGFAKTDTNDNDNPLYSPPELRDHPRLSTLILMRASTVFIN